MHTDREYGPIGQFVWEVLLEVNETQIWYFSGFQKGRQAIILRELLWNYDWNVQADGRRINQVQTDHGLLYAQTRNQCREFPQFENL